MAESIAFIVAMQQEIRPFLRGVGACERTAIDAFPLYRFRLYGTECLLVECGIGLRHATAATQALLAAVHPRLLVSFGVAGAATTDLRVGDVVAVHSVRRFDHGVIEESQVLASWSEPAQGAAALALAARGARLFSGAALTTRREQSVPVAVGQFDHLVLEMETAGIAVVAAQHAVPLLALRSISDSADEPLPFDLQGSLDEEGRLRIGRIVAAAIRNPRLVAGLARLQKNTAHAMENLVDALLPALKAQLSARGMG